MGRKFHTYHAIRHPQEEDPSSGWLHGTSWCGQHAAAIVPKEMTREEQKAEAMRLSNCPACAAAMGKAKLRLLAGRVTVEPYTWPDEDMRRRAMGSRPDDATYTYATFKGAYVVAVDGVQRALVVTRPGFGKGWELHRMPGAALDRLYGLNDLTGGTVSGNRPDTYSARQHSRASDPFQPVHYAARDMMACAALRCLDSLPTPEEAAQRREAAQQARKEEAARREVEAAAAAERRQARDKARAERLALAMDGIAAALDRPDLSNMERAGLEAARAIISNREVTIG